MGGVPSMPELTSDELRLLPLLTTPLSFTEIGRLLDLPRDAVAAEARSIYRKLELSEELDRG